MGSVNAIWGIRTSLSPLIEFTDHHIYRFIKKMWFDNLGDNSPRETK